MTEPMTKEELLNLRGIELRPEARNNVESAQGVDPRRGKRGCG